jgi:hypothetical protein
MHFARVFHAFAILIMCSLSGQALKSGSSIEDNMVITSAEDPTSLQEGNVTVFAHQGKLNKEI